VLSAVLIRAAALDGAVRLRINDALDAGTQLNCARAVHAGSGGVQFAVRCGAHNVERDALTSFLGLLLMFIDFFYGPHFGVAAPPNGGRCAARGVKAARNDLAVHDRNAPVLHANRRFFGFLHCHPNEPRVTVSHAACLFVLIKSIRPFVFKCFLIIFFYNMYITTTLKHARYGNMSAAKNRMIVQLNADRAQNKILFKTIKSHPRSWRGAVNRRLKTQLKAVRAQDNARSCKHTTPNLCLSFS
jgi:hypothetical protein